MTLQLVHREDASSKMGDKPRILVLGPAAHGIAGALFRLQSRAEVCGAETAGEAEVYIRSGNFDHVLVDNRVECGLTLPIMELGRTGAVKNLIVLGDPATSPHLGSIPGIDRIISPPYNPVEIAESLEIEIVDNRRRQFDQPEEYLDRRQPINPIHQMREAAERSLVAEPKEKLFSDLKDKLTGPFHLVPRLTPLISLLYKNVALIFLACLFLAFVSYGIMIVYFLASGGWSTPIQLQRGHELVVKAERELGELKVKRNLVLQQIADAESKAERGRSAVKRAETISRIAEVTIDQEIENRQNRLSSIQSEIDAIDEIINSYGPGDIRKREKKSLQRDYKRRIITRRTYESSLLNLVEIEKSIVSLKEQVSRKEAERLAIRQGVAYLGLLKQQLIAGDEPVVLAGGKAEFVPIANQIIEVQQVRAAGNADVADFEDSRRTLQNSIDVLTASIGELENSPLVRALDKPVNVLFVPYDNLAGYQKEDRLYTCAFTIFWCSNVGTVGEAIPGEISTIHPFFSKPIRGQFVEAYLTDSAAVQKEIFHVGRPPFFL